MLVSEVMYFLLITCVFLLECFTCNFNIRFNIKEKGNATKEKKMFVNTIVRVYDCKFTVLQENVLSNLPTKEFRLFISS